MFKYSRNGLIVFLVTLVLSVNVLTWSNHPAGSARSTIYEMLERIESTNMGFSSIPALLGLAQHNSVSTVIKEDPIKFIQLAVDLPYLALFKGLIGLDNQSYEGRQIEGFSINIPLSSLKVLTGERFIAIESGFLTNRSWVKSTISYKGKVYSAKVRLKGDLDDHWRSQTRMSLDIKIKRGSIMGGLRRFAIHSPRSRTYPYGPIFSKIIRNKGNIYIPQSQAKIKVNGMEWGVMDVEEKVGVDFLERQNKKASIVVSFGDDSDILGNSINRVGNSIYYNGLPRFTIDLEATSKKGYSNIDRMQYGFIIQKYLLDQEPLSVDFEKTAKELAVTLVWGNSHHSGVLNKKHYLNPYSLLLEPISGDVDPPTKILSINNIYKIYDQFMEIFHLSRENCACEQDFKYDLLIRAINILSSNHEILEISRMQADRLSKMFPNDKKYDISALDANLNWVMKNRKTILQKIKSLEEMKDSEVISSSKEQLIDDLDSNNNKSSLNGMLPLVDVYHFDSGRVAIVNLTSSKYKISKIIDLASGDAVDLSIELPESSIKNVSSSTVYTNIKGIKDKQIKVLFHDNNNNDYTAISDISLIDFKSDDYKLDEFQHQVLSNSVINKDRSYKVYRFSKNKVINGLEVYKGTLIIDPGTNVHIKNNGALIVIGKLVAEGDDKNPISVTGSDLGGSVYVFGNHDKSILSNVYFSNMGALSNNILNLTGALTVYNSDLIIRNSVFDNFSSEDVINVVNGSVSFNNIVVKSTISDAADFDFSTGSIRDFSVIDSGGDGLDFSGSTFSLSKILCKNVNDKCISAGEASTINVNDLFVVNSGVGVASKDGSNVIVKKVELSKISLSPFMSYNKKVIFGGAKLNILDDSNKNYSAIRQYGSSLKYNDYEVEAVNLNIDDLYSNTVMKK